MTLKENKSEITEQAKVILNHRYLLKNSDNEVIESPKEMFHRVAKSVSEVVRLSCTSLSVTISFCKSSCDVQ